MATTMAAKEIEALTIASMASRDAVRAMRARGRRGGGRERERERESTTTRWRLRSVGFKRMHARDMDEEREGWLTDGVNARRRETIGVRDVEDRWRPERGGTRDTHGRAGVSGEISYETVRVVGHGSFGVVYQARCRENDEEVAIKKVLQDKRFKNRELQIMKAVDHRNVVKLIHSFYHTTEEDEVYLNLVLEFVPDTVYRIGKHYHKNNQRIPGLLVKLYTYQMARALASVHKLGICHRDIKPQNLLVDTKTHVLKICDFGSAKILAPTEPNISYICSRYYRAPELIFGAVHYTTAIDVWSTGRLWRRCCSGRLCSRATAASINW